MGVPLARTSGITFQVMPPASGGSTALPAYCTLSIGVTSSGNVPADSLAQGVTNGVDIINGNTFWTPATNFYLASNVSANNFILSSVNTCWTRDCEVTTWTQRGYVFMRLTSLTAGTAFYFFHNGESANGTLEIGIVTGVNETAFPSGTAYILYQNTDLVGTVTGYSKTNTTGFTWTFGLSGYDVYVKFNGTEILRFKEYRHMSAGAVALKAFDTDHGFRTVTITPLTVSLYSDTPATKIDMRDWWMRQLATTGTIGPSTNSLTVASPNGFQVGDFIIVEIGNESGAGARGTVGVGGTWPAQSYATTAILLAATPAVDTFAWAQDTGITYQYYGGGVWSDPSSDNLWNTSRFYGHIVLPRSLRARITAIAGSVFTLDTNSVSSATNANVYLDNQLYINDLFQTPRTNPSDLTPITPSNMTIQIPTGSYCIGAYITNSQHSGWTLQGMGQSNTFLYSARGTKGATIYNGANSSNFTVRDLTLSGNYISNSSGYGLQWYEQILPRAASVGTGLQYNSCGQYIVAVTSAVQGQVSESSYGAEWYTEGIEIRNGNNSIVRNVTVNNVMTEGVNLQSISDSHAYDCIVNATVPKQGYTQWQFEMAGGSSNTMERCTFNSVYIGQSFEMFGADHCSFIDCVSVNGGWSFNGCTNFTVTNASLSFDAFSSIALPPGWNVNNPIITVNNNTGPVGTGTFTNTHIFLSSYLSSNNDIQPGFSINPNSSDITITGGSYEAPDYAGPSTLFGPIGIFSQGPKTLVDGFTACGVVFSTAQANIDILGANSSVRNCFADSIISPSCTSNSTCPP